MIDHARMQVGIGKPTSNLHLVPWIRMCGFLPALPVMFSGMILNYTQGQINVMADC